MGGYGICSKGCIIQFKMSNLPNHKSITIKYEQFFVDSWDNTDYFIFQMDNESTTKTYPETIASLNFIFST